MCEAHKPDQWLESEAVRRAVADGGRICEFEDVPEKGNCLAQIEAGADLSWGIKLPKLLDGPNFAVADGKGHWSHLVTLDLGTIVVFIPEAKSPQETVEVTLGNPTPDSAGPGAPFNC